MSMVITRRRTYISNIRREAAVCRSFDAFSVNRLLCPERDKAMRMKVIRLKGNTRIYTCNAYLVMGEWNRLEDVNTLVDIGSDGSIIGEIEAINTGVGKHPVEQIILTHGHFDHSGGVREVKQRYGARVFAFTRSDLVDIVLRDCQYLQMGNRTVQIMHTPGHSNDSICIYCPEDKILFSGDTMLQIRTPGGSYTREYLHALERILKLDIETIYSGHDTPITANIPEMLKTTLENVLKSRIIG